MNKESFKKYKSGIINIKIQSLIPEKFINLLWKRDVSIKNIKKIDITTFTIDINLRDYDKIEEVAKKTNSKIKIMNRKGFSFIMLRVKRRIALVFGIVLFIGIILFLSTFIWSVDIAGDGNIAPYELRQQLTSMGVKPGVSKYSINTNSLEENLIKVNENIMWVRVRFEGGRLKVLVTERQSPPSIITDNTPCNLIAAKEGEVSRIYTKAGTPVVKKGDVIKQGQLLVKGEQGKEGLTYSVHAEGEVICKTIYEETKEVKLEETKRERTGNKTTEIFVTISGKKRFLKKYSGKYEKCDKIENNKLNFGIVTFYEIKESKVKKDSKKLVEDTARDITKKIEANLGKNVKIIDRKVDFEEGEIYKVKVTLQGEENIAIPEKLQ